MFCVSVFALKMVFIKCAIKMRPQKKSDQERIMFHIAINKLVKNTHMVPHFPYDICCIVLTSIPLKQTLCKLKRTAHTWFFPVTSFTLKTTLCLRVLARAKKKEHQNKIEPFQVLYGVITLIV